jgi:uncharacterized protein (TIGR02246 family)
MRYVFLLLALLGLSRPARSQALPAPDSLQLLAQLADWDRAWATKDPVLAAQAYAPDARFTNAFGDQRTGRRAIEALLREVFALPFVMAGTSETHAHRFQPAGPATVLVHTAVVRAGQQLPDGTVLPDRHTSHLRVFRKRGGTWQVVAHLISDARNKHAPGH